ncbi:hypothetical protein WJX73_000296 [Symbiochloris irregularis]|uniref:BRCT domain-containing protein n=1 Tax=Symbiochloris irregularis TaxID=706552 RepID=A0AAW1PAE2_9CHLO
MADQFVWAKGLSICVSGLPKEDRAQIALTVENAGGRYCRNLHRTCSHLVIPSYPTGSMTEKLRHALTHQHKTGIHIVGESWLAACERLQARADEGQYLPCCLSKAKVPARADQSRSRQTLHSNSQGTSTYTASRLGMASAHQAFQPEQTTASENSPSNAVGSLQPAVATSKARAAESEPQAHPAGTRWWLSKPKDNAAPAASRMRIARH